jgi:2-(1,2-epoxy-1,2-dihydrophenyl)acetyl-CoA isomerase
MGDCETILVDRDGPVTTVTINRPKRKNALDVASWTALGDAIAGAARDVDTRVLVLTGANGDFCAGADLAGAGDTHPLRQMHMVNDVALALHHLAKPTIAKVRGVAVGAGWNLALGCDLVAAAPDARFSQIFSRRAMSVDCGGSWLLPRLVGLQQAKRLALLAEFVDATEAARLGLVTWVRPEAELDEFVATIAGRLAVLPPVALAQSKALLNDGAQTTLRQALDNEARAQAVNRGTEDTAIALAAFVNKTDATYAGRWAVR